MKKSVKRRFRITLIATLCAIACWHWIPGSTLDRDAFAAVCRTSTNPPLFIAGHGKHADPWQLKTLAAKFHINPNQAPLIVSLADDTGAFFQTSPPSPIDFAVILTNFQRLGAHHGATATVMAWDHPDPIGLAALDKAINGFDSLVMTAPLSRGATSETIPPSFRRASIPLTSVLGNPENLPIVNRIPIPNIILGNTQNVVAGFQSLDAEPANGDIHLLARWDDRVVLAFPLLVAMQHLHLPIDGIEINLGHTIRLGPNGPIIPIDHYGKLTMNLPLMRGFREVPAESLIDAHDDLFASAGPRPIILRDDRSTREPATRTFSENLTGLTTAMLSDAGLSPAQTCHRPTILSEWIFLTVVITLLAACCQCPTFSRNLLFFLIAASCLIAQCLAASYGLWLPGLAALAAVLAATLISAAINPSAPASGFRS